MQSPALSNAKADTNTIINAIRKTKAHIQRLCSLTCFHCFLNPDRKPVARMAAIIPMIKNIAKLASFGLSAPSRAAQPRKVKNMLIPTHIQYPISLYFIVRLGH